MESLGAAQGVGWGLPLDLQLVAWMASRPMVTPTLRSKSEKRRQTNARHNRNSIAYAEVLSRWTCEKSCIKSRQTSYAYGVACILAALACLWEKAATDWITGSSSCQLSCNAACNKLKPASNTRGTENLPWLASRKKKASSAGPTSKG